MSEISLSVLLAAGITAEIQIIDSATIAFFYFLCLSSLLSWLAFKMLSRSLTVGEGGESHR